MVEVEGSDMKVVFSRGERVSEIHHPHFDAVVTEYVAGKNTEFHKVSVIFGNEKRTREATFSGFPSIGEVLQPIAYLYFLWVFPGGVVAETAIRKRLSRGRLTQDQAQRALCQIACQKFPGKAGHAAKMRIAYIDTLSN